MIQKTKSISELYEETKNSDLVITNDAPLNTALNKSINQPLLGEFALTSKLIGSKYLDYFFEKNNLEDEELVLKVQNKFKLSLKEALYYSKNILTIYQHTGEIEKTKNYISHKEKEIVDYIKTLPNYQLAMENMNLDFLQKQKIATIGVELFDALDKKVLTKPTTNISPFKNQKHELETIYLFNSQKDIINQITSMITKQNQNATAVVLNIESEYLPLIKAKLINKGINLNEKLTLNQEFKTREYLSIIEAFYSIHNTYTKELIPIANIFEIDIETSKENVLFLELCDQNQNAKKLYNLLNKLKQKTFYELLIELEKYNLETPEKLKDILNKLKINNEKITKEKFLELKYFIENFEEEFENNKSGVLLVDAKNSTYINRDIIFYIGMDYTWTKTIDNQKYINKEEELEKNIKKFEILIQQGIERFFFVPKITQRIDTIPPYYFNFLFEDTVENYSKDFFKIEEINNSYEVEEIEFNPVFEKSKINLKETISSSALNNLSQCPKKFEYSKLAPSIEKEVFIKGNLIHFFAEFYVSNKEFVKNKEIDEFVDIIMVQLKLVSNPYQNLVQRTKIKFACETIIDFIDSLDINENIDVPSSKEISKKNKENIFARHYNKPINFLNSELEFKDLDLKLNGVIDLIVNDFLIVDYKSSKKKKSVSEIIKNSNFKEITSKCDFQPLIYLTFFRKIKPNQKIQFQYSYPMIFTYEKLMNKEHDENTLTINYIPNSFQEFIQTDFFKQYFFEHLGKKTANIFNEYNSMEFFKDKKLDEESDYLIENYEKEFLQFHINKGLKDTKANIEEILKLLRYILGFRFGKQIGAKGQKEAFFFKEDLDEFEVFVKNSISKLNSYIETIFPYAPVEDEITCEDCDFKKICLKRF